MSKKVNISIATKGNNRDFASSLILYIPVDVRRAANIESGDTFEYKVSNNKLALRYSSKGDINFLDTGQIHLRANLFEPPLRVKPSLRIEAVIHDGWLVFQIPQEFEYREKGFHLV